MHLRTTTLPAKTFIGKHFTMSFVQNKTFELWRGFMPQRKEIKHTVGTELYSMEVYPTGFFANFNPASQFEKWAAVEVSEVEEIPVGMEMLNTPEGLYAVFLHTGPASEGARTYDYIFREWLPQSEYEVDDRPHFAVMGEKYQQDSPASEEELWIPIRKK
ncbi:GyrI-like domain-containing protein [Mucilaginibacter mali]|uniref:GyrI-like domain-containing protein n=1 Tax=Mucilaginibacter mali TaxID=2740462 RepID=A0A7D4QC17_9SPHI|nr:GyrI-like domain-containing protein [Mucilaginibacter mali]QKJ30944.1 GyrI-like domain-containing protein [Mucilaginibacter mali]